MRTLTLSALALAATALIQPNPARACGGLFCGRTPVDQNAERIIFVINDDDTTDMIVQISYQGAAEDFAWILPVGDVPENRTTFPQLAITALATATDPSFQLHPDCWDQLPIAEAVPSADAGAGGGDDRDGVNVIVREEVGPFELVVLQSDDPEETASWLRSNKFRISEAMDQYVKLYTEEGMMFMALRLLADKEAQDIEPIRFTLPGTNPTIPLRLTTVAAEPEMGILAFIFGDMRYGPAEPVQELEIDESELRWDPWSYGSVNNWTALVARAADAVDGKGFVAEVAGSTQDLRQQIMNSFTRDEQQMEAQQALLELIEGHDYMTRLYTRLSPSEMTFDPMFKRSDAGDVDRVKQLPYVKELCEFDFNDQPPPTPCDFASCGALGLCVEEMVDDQPVATCACAPGGTARTTFDPAGRTIVACQEEALSFLNPGDKNVDGEALPDPCVGFDCGEHGTCVAMNMTPTCRCDKGYVARGWLEDGARRTMCMRATKSIPTDFYNRRPKPRDPSMPVGRVVDIPEPSGPPDTAGTAPRAGSAGSCSAGAVGTGASGISLWVFALLGAARLRRRRSGRG